MTMPDIHPHAWADDVVNSHFVGFYWECHSFVCLCGIAKQGGSNGFKEVVSGS